MQLEGLRDRPRQRMWLVQGQSPAVLCQHQRPLLLQPADFTQGRQSRSPPNHLSFLQPLTIPATPREAQSWPSGGVQGTHKRAPLSHPLTTTCRFKRNSQ